MQYDILILCIFVIIFHNNSIKNYKFTRISATCNVWYQNQKYEVHNNKNIKQNIY